jgi:DNA-binding HxlR family transcriptional regulator
MKVNRKKMSLKILSSPKEKDCGCADASAVAGDRSKCSATELVRIIGRSYGLELLTAIKKKRGIRFNELKTVMGKISSSTLTIRLTELERAGLVERQTQPEVTARAEYSLTKKGKKLLQSLNSLSRLP